MSSCEAISPLRRVLLEALVLCSFAAAVGLSVNFQLIFQVFSGESGVAVSPPPIVEPAAVAEPSEEIEALPFPVHLDELDMFLEIGALFVDARSREAYREGHLPGAVSLPLVEVTQGMAQFKQQVDTERTLITYCGGYGCLDSFDIGVALLAAGFEEVLVYEGGIPEWQAAERQIVKGEE